MPTYEYSAFITVHAETREEADEAAHMLAEHVSRSGDASIALDDSEPSIEED